MPTVPPDAATLESVKINFGIRPCRGCSVQLDLASVMTCSMEILVKLPFEMLQQHQQVYLWLQVWLQFSRHSQLQISINS